MYIEDIYWDCSKSIDELMEGVENDDPGALYVIGRRMDEGDGLRQDRRTGIGYIERSAEKGYAPAQNYMGYLYSCGDYLPKDEAKAADWFRRAADQGLPKAKYNLSFYYQDGSGGVTKDQAKYFGLLSDAAVDGYPPAMYELGEAYYYGDGVHKDYTQAASWYRMAAEQCHTDSQYSIGYMYEHGYGVELDLDEAVRWYRDASEKGYHDASYRIGMILFYKCNGHEDEGIQSFKRASDQGSRKACYALYLIYSGDYDCKDPTEARYWLFKGVAKNNLACIEETAKQYLSGTLLPYNPVLAVKCYEKGIEMRDEECMYLLGELYETGEHVEKDLEKSMELMRMAAAAGDCRAQSRLGDHYMYGEGDDTDLALYWFRLAARNGNVMAMKELARIYEQGLIVTQSIERALYWYNRAYLRGDELAKSEVDRLQLCYNPMRPEEEEGPAERSMRQSIENDDPIECYNMGMRFMDGEDGFEVDMEKSRLWLERGSDMGDIGCLDNLGYIYYTGKGTEKDLEKAESCFRKAAELGSPYSQAMLGYMYCKGEYLQKNEIEGGRWLKRAERQGYGDMVVSLFRANREDGAPLR